MPGVTVQSIYWPDPLTLVGTYGPRGEYPIYSDLLPAFAKSIKRRIAADYCATIVIDGPTGSGKSTLALQLARTLNRDWKLSDNYIYSVEDLKRKLESDESNPVILFDEGSVSLNSLSATSKSGREISVLFDCLRSRHITALIAIPSIWSLNKRIRETHVNYKLECSNKAPLPGYSARGFFKIYSHKVYPLSGKSYWQPMGTGIYAPISTRFNNEYQRVKRASQDKLIKNFIKDDSIC